MRRSLALIAGVIACGTPSPTVVQLPPAASASAAPASTVAITNACAVWKACRRVGEPVRVSGAKIGQSPDVTWDGREALVAYETPRDGTHLAAVAIDGHVLWTALVAGMAPRIAWNDRTRMGLLVTSETIAWLGRDGRPVHETSAPHATNIGFRFGVAPLADGFLIASGVGSHASNAPPIAFSIARVGAPADVIDWKRVDDDGLRGAPLVSSWNGWMVSQPFKSPAQLYRVTDSGEAGSALALSNAPSTRAVAFDAPYVIFADDQTHALSFAFSNGTPVDLGARSTRSGSAIVLQIGGQVVLGGDKLDDTPGVALAPLDLEPAPHLRAGLAIGPQNSQQLRAVATDRGFVATWNVQDDGAPLVPLMNGPPMHGLSAMLAVYTCCPDP